MKDTVAQCELTPYHAPYEAGAWIIPRVDDPAGEVLAVALVSAVLTTQPDRIVLTLAHTDGGIRITAAGSTPVTTAALTPVGREIMEHFAVEYGATAPYGLWAEISATS